MNSTRPCPVCRHAIQVAAADPACPRCAAGIPPVRPRGPVQAAAFGGAALLALFPAYLLPVMSVEIMGRVHADTILSGVRKLWHQGMWGIALIVFTASLLVPILKLSGLGLLLAGARWPGLAPAATLARLYAFVHFIGRWSMLDIFLVAFLCGIVRFDSLAQVRAQPGALAFAAAVILTMLATAAFDPAHLRDTPAPDSPACSS